MTPLVQKLPVNLKLSNLNKIIKMDENEIGKLHKTNDGKVILRKAMSRHIPDDIHNAVKQGFSSPAQSWVKEVVLTMLKKNY